MWKKCKSVSEIHKPVRLNMRSCRYNGRLFAAGDCGIKIGDVPIEAIAVKAGRSKRVTTYEHAVEWLVKHGCNRSLASALVRNAD